MKILSALLGLFLCLNVFADTAVISWTASERAEGYRVYKFNPEKTLLIETTELTHTEDFFEPTVFGVTVFNEYGESEIVPRAVFPIIKKPKTINFQITVEVE
jgi:hypothetical protein